MLVVQRLAGWRGRVDALLVNEEIHFPGVDLGKEIDQVGEGSSQSIRRVSQRRIPLWSFPHDACSFYYPYVMLTTPRLTREVCFLNLFVHRHPWYCDCIQVPMYVLM